MARNATPCADSGDPAPSNLLWIDRRVVFVDFEYAANRHALFDLAQWYMRCPLPSAWFAALADGVAHRLVSRGMFASRARFDAALQRMCQHAGLYMLTWLPIAAALERDRPWVADWTVRRATLSSLLRLAAVTPPNSALRDASTSLHRALSSRWGDSGDCNIDWAGMIQSSRR
ncbi:MAG: phosphotransferase [Gammaproteobacteria bacterium]|nr:phosphotransferase [Gammaproteobacteria bacterium]